jgi:hypothetical protein
LSSTEDGRTTSGRRTQPSEGVRLSTWTGTGGGTEQKSTETVKQSAIGAHPPYYPYVGGVGAPLTLPPSPSPRPSSHRPENPHHRRGCRPRDLHRPPPLQRHPRGQARRALVASWARPLPAWCGWRRRTDCVIVLQIPPGWLSQHDHRRRQTRRLAVPPSRRDQTWFRVGHDPRQGDLHCPGHRRASSTDQGLPS